jgi:hypothetical protein
MMDELLRIAAELRPGLRDFLAGPIAEGRIQGALLEVDSYWYFSAMRETLPWSKGWLDWDRDYVLAEIQTYSAFQSPLLDWKYRPWDWPEHCRAMGYLVGSLDAPSPVLIRVLLRDPTERFGPISKGGMPSFPIPPLDSNLPRRFGQYAITYELRPSAIATSGIAAMLEKLHLRSRDARQAPDVRPGSIGRAAPNTAGTIGGFLRDPASGQNYLVSCAHVLGPYGTEVHSPGPYEGRHSTHVGAVRFSSISPLKPAVEACSFHIAPDAGRLDIAIAEVGTDELERSFLPNRVRAISQIHRFQSVMFRGKESGSVAAQMNSATVWQEIYTQNFGDGPEGFRCFGDIFELASPQGDVAPIAVEGDSGAWVTDEVGALRNWVGVLIGNQGTRAYGCFAEHILNAVRQYPWFPNGLALPS